jgi:hypothetical protein
MSALVVSRVRSARDACGGRLVSLCVVEVLSGGDPQKVAAAATIVMVCLIMLFRLMNTILFNGSCHRRKGRHEYERLRDVDEMGGTMKGTLRGQGKLLTMMPAFLGEVGAEIQAKSEVDKRAHKVRASQCGARPCMCTTARVPLCILSLPVDLCAYHRCPLIPVHTTSLSVDLCPYRR